MTAENLVDVRRLRRREKRGQESGVRKPDYRKLRNPFVPHSVFSADQINAIHETALRVLEELGVKVLLDEAVKVYRSAGAIVAEDTQMVRIGRELVSAALASAPRSFRGVAGNPAYDIDFTLGALTFVAGCGAPNVTDLDRGRRAGTIADFESFVKLTQSYDVLHFHGPYVEAQDIENRFRHYAVNRAQLTLSDKLPFLFARGTPQVADGFEMIRLARNLSEAEFRSDVHCFTVINTNSPRQLDIPMAQGIIDFAKAGQATIITPFCLAGAMAPISVAGALTLQHAEALAGLVLAQLVRPGAPVVYGSFSSNVDMKSGAPAFGTPEHMKATVGAGQLARLLGLPWRSGGGSSSNAADVQGAMETQFALWGSLLAGATVCVHVAGWMEGGLANSYEKLITDIECLQMVAEMCVPTPGDEDEIGFNAIAEVPPGGHFFSAQHTMARYRTAFYEPIVSDWSNFGNWTEAGARSATQRANSVWKEKLAGFEAPPAAAASSEILDEFIARRKESGGANPVS